MTTSPLLNYGRFLALFRARDILEFRKKCKSFCRRWLEACLDRNQSVWCDHLSQGWHSLASSPCKWCHSHVSIREQGWSQPHSSELETPRTSSLFASGRRALHRWGSQWQSIVFQAFRTHSGVSQWRDGWFSPGSFAQLAYSWSVPFSAPCLS